MKSVIISILTFLYLQFTQLQAESIGSIRLWRNGVASPSFTSGRLQVYISEWGNVCGYSDTAFTLDAANVACHQLGFTGAVSKTPDYSTGIKLNDDYGTDTSPTTILRFNCGSNPDDYLVLFQCSFSLYIPTIHSNCWYDSDEVGVACYDSRLWDDPFPGMVRLQNGPYSSQGTVEVFCNGIWSTLCGNSFTANDANSICIQLGYKGAQSYNYVQLSSSVLQWFDSLSCLSYQSCISECQSCPNIQTPPYTCPNVAYVQCAYVNPGTKGGSTRSQCNSDSYPRGEGAIRLSRNDLSSLEYSSGRVQVYYNGVWGNVCRLGGFNASAADVICHQLGWTGSSEWSYTSLDSYGVDVRPTFFNNIVCTDSSLLVLQQCSYNTDTTLCTDSDDVSVTCYTSRIWDSPFSGMVRLTGTKFINEGVVEVYCNDQWGTVCNRNIDSSDRRAICRQLGYSQAFTAPDNELVVSPVKSSFPIWLDNLFCFSGIRYNCISECQSCPSVPSTNIDCLSHSTDLTVQCYIDEDIAPLTQTVDECQVSSQNDDAGVEGSLILRRNGIDSPVHSSGIVVLYHGGQWGNICRLSSFTILEAGVICHQLSYTGASSWSYGDDHSFGVDTRITVINDMSCSLGSELTALQCDFTDIFNNDCHDANDVAVTCYTSRIWENPFTGMVRLMGGDFTNEGRVEVYCSGQWGTVCDNAFGSSDAVVVCRQLGYDLVNRVNYANLPGNSSSPIWLNSLQCSSSSSLSCITQCQACPNGSVSTCTHTQDSTVRCVHSQSSSIAYFNGLDRSCELQPTSVPDDPTDGSMILGRNDSYSLSYTSGRVVVRFNNRWSTICRNNFFSITEADVICHQLTYSGASSWSYADIDGFGSNSALIGFKDLQCIDNGYLSMFQCSFNTNSIGCNIGDQISVSCYSSPIWNNPFNGMIRLSQGNYHTVGLLEVFCNEQWGTVCDDTFSSTAATAACRQLGYQNYDLYDHLSLTGSSDDPIWFDSIICSGFSDVNCLTDCQRCPSSQNHNCVHSEDITLRCRPSSSITTTNRIRSCQYSSPVSVGAIVGGVCGGLAVIIIIIIVGCIYYKKQVQQGNCPDIRNCRSWIQNLITNITNIHTPSSSNSRIDQLNEIPLQPATSSTVHEAPQPYIQPTTTTTTTTTDTTVFNRPPPPSYNNTTFDNDYTTDKITTTTTATTGFSSNEPPPYDPNWQKH